METPISFSNLPNDIKLNIVSFLQPIDISSLARTCRHFCSLCNPSSPSLWSALCDRRWGAQTNPKLWSAAPSLRLYETLDLSESLIGFWSLLGDTSPSSPSLVLFEWQSSCITGFDLSPAPGAASYSVRKTPFLRLGSSAAGEALGLLVPDGAPVTVGFVGRGKIVVEERRVDRRADGWDGSMADQVMAELYAYFANREDGRRGNRKERERVGRRRREPDYFVKIFDCFPTPARPLQGLWKVIV